MRRVLLAIALCFVLTSPSMATTETGPTDVVKQKIAAANQKINTIESAELNKWIEEGTTDFILLDVREASEVGAGKIEADDYLAIPRGLVEFQFSKKVKELDKPIVVYCLKGSRGALAAGTLAELGYTNVYNLKGGVLDWIQTGYTVSNFFGDFEVQNFDSNF